VARGHEYHETIDVAVGDHLQVLAQNANMRRVLETTVHAMGKFKEGTAGLAAGLQLQ
jgi:hypothetical protein